MLEIIEYLRNHKKAEYIIMYEQDFKETYCRN